jgi:hypothetical protein
MIKISIGALAFICGAFFFAGSVDLKRVSGPSGVTVSYEVMVSKAYAGKKKRVRRRAARKRRARRTVIVSGCIWVDPYYYCDGVYYQGVIENGQKVYYVVIP